MALRENIPGIGAAGGAAAIAGDLLINGGDMLVSLFMFLLFQPDAWLSIALYAEQLAGLVAWVPREPIEMLVVAGLVLTILVSVGRLIDRWRGST